MSILWDMAISVHDLALPDLDLVTPPQDRASMLARVDVARPEHWLARGPFGFAITRHEEVGAFLRDRRFFQAARLLTQGRDDIDPRLAEKRRESVLTAEGDTHSRLRRLVAPAFSPKATDRLRPFMRDVMTSLVDAVSETGRCELVADVCEPYPIPIMCELLGAPKQDWELFSRWASDLLSIFNNDLVNDGPRILTARDELDVYVRALIERRRSEPRDDLITALIAAEESGDRLSTDELVSMVEAVIVAGTDTTRNQLSCSLHVLAHHPDQWALLAERPELANGAVDETMRVLGAVRGTARFAPEDIEFNDVLFPAGTLIFPTFLGSNFDPAAFEDPHRFDITRQGSASHMTFGAGIHFCLGYSLAKAELQEALPLLAQRMPDLRVDGEVTWKPASFGIWGAEALPLRFTPTPSSGMTPIVARSA
jgi:cytochrome P450